MYAGGFNRQIEVLLLLLGACGIIADAGIVDVFCIYSFVLLLWRSQEMSRVSKAIPVTSKKISYE